jgi:hypothetical protein
MGRSDNGSRPEPGLEPENVILLITARSLKEFGLPLASYWVTVRVRSLGDRDTGRQGHLHGVV